MCKSKSEGGQRCAAHGGVRPQRLLPTEPAPRSQHVNNIPDMPAWYEPERGAVSRFLTPVLSDKARRFFWYREQGWTGPIAQDGWPAMKGKR